MPPRPRLIAVIDDDIEFLRYVHVALGVEGYACITFQSATSALDYFRYQLPALAIIDYYLPDADGVTLLRELRAAPATKALPVVLTTGPAVLTMRSLQIAARELDATLLLKPYDVDTLSSVLDRLLPPDTD
jgi:DNA-binding response OmpR family regulator